MILIFIGVSGTPTEQRLTKARFWLEASEHAAFGEIEIELALQGPGQWTGRVPKELLGQSRGFMYRLALAALPNAIWTLKLIDERTDAVLHCDSDVMARCKAWLVGSVEVRGKRLPQPLSAQQVSFGHANVIPMRLRDRCR